MRNIPKVRIHYFYRGGSLKLHQTLITFCSVSFCSLGLLEPEDDVTASLLIVGKYRVAHEMSYH